MRWAVMLLALALAACGPTGYVKKEGHNPEFGYSDKPMGDGEFSVVASGNGATSPKRVAEIALLRAAHLTREQGRKRFLIVQQKAQVLEAYPMDSVPVMLPGVMIVVSFQARKAKEPIAVLIIRPLPDAPGASEPGTVDAAKVIAELAPHFR